MPSNIRHFYEFGDFRLDADKHRLLRDGEVVPLSPKAVEALFVLVRNPGKPLEREALMQAVWAESFVEDANLTVAISHLRKALGQNGETAEYIETIPRLGYRFVAEVREAYEEPKSLIVEKHTQSRTVIEEELLPDHDPVTEAIVVRDASSFARMLPVNRTLAQIAAGTILILTLGSFLYFRRGNERDAAAGNPTASRIRSIAVLPPKSLNNQSENPALSLGIADALIARLGGIQKIVVRPTSAIARYAGLNQDSLTAGRALGVDAVVDGTLQRDQGRMRIRLRLLNVSDGRQLWTGSFDEGDADLFKLQDSISQQLGSALYSDLSQNEKESLSKQQTKNTDAYALYLQGNYFWNKRGPEAGKSVEYFRKAIELDPNFAQAYASLAAVDATGAIPSPEADSLIDKALRLDDSLAEAHATLGLIKMFHHWDWVAAETELNRAIELNPNSSVAHHWKGTYLSIRGRFDEAKAEMHRALELDPVSLIIMADIGQVHYFAHEYDQAIEYCNKALALDPDFRVAHWYLLDIYWAKGADEAVLNELPSLEFRSSPAETKQHLRQIFERGGLREIVAEQIASQANDKVVTPINMARLYSRIGDKEHAVFWLDRAVSGQRMFLTAYTGVDPLYDSLHADPRFKSIVNQMGLGT